MCNPDIFRTLVYSQLWIYSEIKAYSEHCWISKIEHFIKNPVLTIRNLDVWYIQNFRLFRTRVCQLLVNVSANFLELLTSCLLLLLHPVLFIKCITYSLSIDFFNQLLITHSIIDIWQNFGYGLRVRRKEKYLYIRKCNNIRNNCKKRNSWK